MTYRSLLNYSTMRLFPSSLTFYLRKDIKPQYNAAKPIKPEIILAYICNCIYFCGNMQY